MCRIAGIIDQHLPPSELRSRVKRMCNIMAHGGPDDEGLYQMEENGLVLGHRRLSLIDLSAAGHQPMTYQEGQLVISFNGEIYNYREIKEELKSLGFGFSTHSDTEVILAGYACWGVALFERLKGMFAFALYDKLKESTFLVRDHSGIKPLYYSIQDKQLVFASEVRAFSFNHLTENPDWKIYFLAFGHIPEPYTTLKDVFMLPKASYLKWDHRSNEATFFSFEETITPKVVSSLTTEKQVENALEKAVKRHLIADAPIGVFLSGGIDSSLLTLLANKLLKSATAEDQQNLLNTVSINFENPAFSEKVYQDEVLSVVSAKHAVYTVDESEFNTHFPTALKAMDQPTADGINSWFVNYYAKKNGLKAVLSGVGADELFGGYPSFKRMGIVNKLIQLPSWALKMALKLSQPSLKRVYYLSYKNTVGKYLFLRGFFTPDDISRLLNLPIKQIDLVLETANIGTMPSDLQLEEQASWLETNLYMQNQLLKDTDSMSMQHGIEVRVPYLDQDLMQLVKELPNETKYKTDRPKGLLIDSFIKLLPRKIWDRPKMGFTFPFQYWLQANEGFLSAMDLAGNGKAAALIEEFKKGKLHWSKALALYQIFKK